METYVLAFLVLFMPVSLGDNYVSVATRPLALQVCQSVYPNGRVILNSPLKVTSPKTGTEASTPHVWQCLRPIEKTDDKKGRGV